MIDVEFGRPGHRGVKREQKIDAVSTKVLTFEANPNDGRISENLRTI